MTQGTCHIRVGESDSQKHLRKLNKDGSKTLFRSSTEERTSQNAVSKQPEPRFETIVLGALHIWYAHTHHTFKHIHKVMYMILKEEIQL